MVLIPYVYLLYIYSYILYYRIPTYYVILNKLTLWKLSIIYLCLHEP